jgi:lactate dehydrogenase-like 2-hydroxyacid dehydrogenase
MEAQVRLEGFGVPPARSQPPSHRSRNQHSFSGPSSKPLLALGSSHFRRRNRTSQNAPVLRPQTCQLCKQSSQQADRNLSSRSSINSAGVIGTLGQPNAAPQKKGFRIRALDAAMPFDYESKKQRELREKSKLTIGVVGFGNFGRFMAKRMIEHGHKVLAYSRSDYSQIAADMGAHYFR